MPYRYLDDIATADVAFEAWGATMTEMFEAAAQATLHLMMEDPGRLRSSVCREMNLSADSVEMLLFDLLQELIYYKDTEQLLLVISSLTISQTAGMFHLHAQACGQVLTQINAPLGVDVKAVTLHRFAVTQLPRGWQASVVLDI